MWLGNRNGHLALMTNGWGGKTIGLSIGMWKDEYDRAQEKINGA
jgi:hypothetical protein